MMNPEVKELWLEALKEYPQTRSSLRDENGFCCLGVLCDVYAKTTGTGDWKDRSFCGPSLIFSVGTEEEASVLPNAVATWAGLQPMPMIEYSGSRLTIATLNDGGHGHVDIEPMNFAQISEIIKEQL